MYNQHGNVLDPAVLVQSFVHRLKRHVGLLQNLLVSLLNFRCNPTVEYVVALFSLGYPVLAVE
jgi:hypothetical protein